MTYYSQTDFDHNAKEKKRAMRQMALCALPFFALAVAAFVLRIELLCMLSCIACGAALILLTDMKLMPCVRYGRYLREVNSGSSHKTLGTLVRIGTDPCYEDGVNFFEVILNIYEDQSEEGERRFLLDGAKTMPSEWLGSDVVVTSHGNQILAAELYTKGEKEAQV